MIIKTAPYLALCECGERGYIKLPTGTRSVDLHAKDIAKDVIKWGHMRGFITPTEKDILLYQVEVSSLRETASLKEVFSRVYEANINITNSTGDLFFTEALGIKVFQN